MGQDTQTQQTKEIVTNTKGWQPSLVVCIAASVLGIALATVILFLKYPFFSLDAPELGISPKPEDVEKFRAAHHQYWTQNHAAAYGLVGLCLAAAWGLITTRKSRLISFVVAGLAAAVIGAAAGYATGPLYAKAAIESAEQTLVQSAVYHGVVWIAVLVPMMFVLGLLQENATKATHCAIIAILVGLANAMLYLVAASIVAQGENLANLVPNQSIAKVLWAIIASLTVGIGGYMALKPAKK